MKKFHFLLFILIFNKVSLLSNIKQAFIPNMSFHLTIDKLVTLHGPTETLETIKKIIEQREKGAYIRFEQKEIHIVLGKNSYSNQMKNVFSLHNKNILKALPFTYKESEILFGMYDRKFIDCTNTLKRLKPFWGEMKDVYSSFALHHMAVNKMDYCLKFLRFLKYNNCYLFISDKKVPKELVSLLFGKNCKFLFASSSKNIEDLEKECLGKMAADKNYKIIVTAMGSPGKILQKRLWDKLDNIFLFDFDYLIDALWGRNKHIEETFDVVAFISKLASEVKIVCTAALIDKHFAGRKAEYIKSLNIISKFGYEPYIVEACKKGRTFLNDYSSHVFYPDVNDLRLKNKGVNEARSLIACLNKFDFSDDDMVVKLTGRYFFKDDSFLRLIEENPDIDVFVKLYTNMGGDFWAFSGCFALRYTYFKDMLKNLDLNHMENKLISFEKEVLYYIRELEKQGAKIMYVDTLNVASHVFLGRYDPHRLTHW